LYPYRASAVKNKQRFNFGALYPESWAHTNGDPVFMQTECLLQGNVQTTLDIKVRFLHLISREVFEQQGRGGSSARLGKWSDTHFRKVESLEVNGQLFQSWQEALERDFTVPRLSVETLLNGSVPYFFSFPSTVSQEDILAGKDIAGSLIRRQESIEGSIEVSAE